MRWKWDEMRWDENEMRWDEMKMRWVPQPQAWWIIRSVIDEGSDVYVVDLVAKIYIQYNFITFYNVSNLILCYLI
jgi:hypothetical protein